MKSRAERVQGEWHIIYAMEDIISRYVQPIFVRFIDFHRER